MIQLKLEEALECLECIGQLSGMRDKEYAGALDAKYKEIAELEEDKRRLNEQVNDLVISSNKHEKENARILIAGLVIGAIVGATGAVLWMGLS
ncbi:MAG: hypothetical protein NMNS01_30680 [Nitrosomonas sp.]|nr:MAG: hypothetical protein NMNS01_30680 [Nitrosomonas sp.]